MGTNQIKWYRIIHPWIPLLRPYISSNIICNIIHVKNSQNTNLLDYYLVHLRWFMVSVFSLQVLCIFFFCSLYGYFHQMALRTESRWSFNLFSVVPFLSYKWTIKSKEDLKFISFACWETISKIWSVDFSIAVNLNFGAVIWLPNKIT